MNVAMVVPAHNAEAWIRRAINSALNQTVRPAELIVVDDGSTDDTARMVRQYGEEVVYVHQENAGPSVARNRGIDLARSEWIAFLDADDEWLPHKTERQLRVLEDNPDLRWCVAAVCRRGRNSAAPYSPPLRPARDGSNQTRVGYFSAVLKRAQFITSGFIIHRSLLEESGGFDPEMRGGEDVDLWCRIALQHPLIGYCSEPCWIYHQDNPGSAHRRAAGCRDLPVKSFCRNMRLAMKLGPEVAGAFRPYARKKVLDSLLRKAARECRISRATLDEANQLFPLEVYEKVLLRSVAVMPKAIASKIAGRLRDVVAL